MVLIASNICLVSLRAKLCVSFVALMAVLPVLCIMICVAYVRNSHKQPGMSIALYVYVEMIKIQAIY